MSEHLEDYVKRSLKQGMTQQQITEKLLGMGWEQQHIDEFFTNFNHKKKLHKKQKVMAIITASFLILGIIAIIFLSPRSPLAARIQVEDVGGQAAAHVENIDQINEPVQQEEPSGVLPQSTTDILKNDASLPEEIRDVI